MILAEFVLVVNFAYCIFSRDHALLLLVRKCRKATDSYVSLDDFYVSVVEYLAYIVLLLISFSLANFCFIRFLLIFRKMCGQCLGLFQPSLGMSEINSPNWSYVPRLISESKPDFCELITASRKYYMTRSWLTPYLPLCSL